MFNVQILRSTENWKEAKENLLVITTFLHTAFTLCIFKEAIGSVEVCMNGLCGSDLKRGISLPSTADWSELSLMAHSTIKDAYKYDLILS